MDNKPIVTCHGDQTLFSRLHTAVVQGLPRESVEWKSRSYGRPCRLHIEANFVPFNPDILPDENDWCLPGRPFLHTYWLDCDLDSYKSGYKEEIAEWLAAMRSRNIYDWLIVIAVVDDNKVKSKLLRTSVYDKVKNDFCNRQTERCVILSEPFKSEAKSAESWAAFFARTRQLLLQSYNRNLGKFEEHMRAERERRTEPGWNFCSYFLLQEELALMFEMLHLHEEALIQYDELDALFTQYVLNHVAGDKAEWLSTFIVDQHMTWDGLSLVQPINVAKRTLIKRVKASLLDFRNYLFSRQTALTFLLNKPWEVARRSIPFMQNCIQELSMLKVAMPPGSMAVWVFLSSLEILYTCDKRTSSSNREELNRHAAGLWDFARLKLHEIAEVCGFLSPSSSLEQSAECVSNLMKGASVRIQKWSSDSQEEDREPIQRLLDALTSKESFQKHYLELSELAMGTYKFIGRIRSARMVGRDLASYYMKEKDWRKAEGFLQDALKVYKQDGWDMLADDTSLDIAECQRQMGNKEKLLRTCAFVAGSSYHGSEIRQQMFEEMKSLSKLFVDNPVLVRPEPALWIVDINPVVQSLPIGDESAVTLIIHSKLPSSVTCDHIELSCTLDDTLSELGDDALFAHRRALRRRHSSETSFTGLDIHNFERYPLLGYVSELDLHEEIELRVDNKTIGACRITHKDTDLSIVAGPRAQKEKELTKESYEYCLRVGQVELHPGDTEVTLAGTFMDRGYYRLSQASIKLVGLDFVKSLKSYDVGFTLICEEAKIEFQADEETLIAGNLQEFKLSVKSGSYGIPEGTELFLRGTRGLQLTCPALDDGVIVLPACDPYKDLSYIVEVFCDPDDGPSDEVITQQVDIDIPSLDSKFQFDIHFQNPFQLKKALHSAGQRCFLQVLVNVSTASRFTLRRPLVEVDNLPDDLQLALMNNPDQKTTVAPKQCVSFIWQIQGPMPLKLKLNGVFKVVFSPCDRATVARELLSKFSLSQ